mgnify:CR=1 FL=1
MSNARTTPTKFEELGGEPALWAIIDRFVDRVCDDIMIGFFFRNVDRTRLKRHEYEHAARMLGARIEYTGRNLRQAHAKHPIMGGQFARRKTILGQVLEEFQVPEHIREAWLVHTEKLRPLITRDAGSDCDPDAAQARISGND